MTPAILIDCSHEPWRENLPDIETLCRRAAEATLRAAPQDDLPLARLEIGLLLTDDAEVWELNRDYRGQDKPTNVLSFAALDADSPIPTDGPILLGDVVIAHALCAAEAAAESKTLADHLSHLVVHGVLHLLGYDHEEDEEAEQMESLERSILRALDIADPYRDGVS